MSKPQSPNIRAFILGWLLAALLLYPLVITPIMFLYRLITEQLPLLEAIEQTFSRYGSPWHGGQTDLLALMFFGFTLATAVVQNWLLARVLHIHLHRWWLFTVIGGFIGTLLMIAFFLPDPLYMLPWFAALSIAQWWTIRHIAAHAWLWVAAHSALSLLFPLYGEGIEIIARWCVAMLIYAGAMLLVIQELAQHARLDKVKQADANG